MGWSIIQAVVVCMGCTVATNAFAVVRAPLTPVKSSQTPNGGGRKHMHMGPYDGKERFWSPSSRRSMIGEILLPTTLFSVTTIAGKPLVSEAAVRRIKGGGPIVKLDSGAQYQDMTIGDGATPHMGDRVAVHYSLFYNGLEVESSRDSQGLAARPLGFTFGTSTGPGSIPAGLQQCIDGMQVGGRRKIVLPPDLAFGKEGRPPFVPGGATVQFDVSLWSVKPAGVNPNLTLPGSATVF